MAVGQHDADKRYQIFLSSTFVDLREERQAVTQALLQQGRCIPAGMELFNASSLPPWEYITRVLDNTDYLVLLLGSRYGSVPPEGPPSYTEREYNYAKTLDIPVLAFVAGDDRSVTAGQVDKTPKDRKALAAFQAQIRAVHTVSEWTTPAELATLVVNSLGREFQLRPRPGWVRGDAPSLGQATASNQDYGASEVRLQHELRVLADMSSQHGITGLQHLTGLLRSFVTSRTPDNELTIARQVLGVRPPPQGAEELAALDAASMAGGHPADARSSRDSGRIARVGHEIAEAIDRRYG